MQKLYPCQNERGAALVIALMFLAIVALLGSTAVLMSTVDIQIGANYKSTNQSFTDARAGIGFAVGKMEAGLRDGSLPFSFPANIGDSTSQNLTTHFGTPTGFSFSLSQLRKIADNLWTFSIDGTDPNTATANTMLKVTLRRDSAISFAAFGDKKLDTKNGGTTLSYNSGSSDPTANDPGDASYQTTHEADVGSNDWLVTHNGATIDGSGVFGAKVDGSATRDGIHGGTTFYNTTPQNVGRVDPDPLGVTTVGGEYNPTTYAPPNNDNLTGITFHDGSSNYDPITHKLTVWSSGKVTLTAGDYYFSAVELKNSAELEIDASGGEVRIFLTGPWDTKSSSIVTVIGDATDFSIFSNSTDKIDFKHDSEFKGFVYAPYAPVDIKNTADVYGAIWGSEVDIKNSGTLYFDSALKDKYLSKDLTVVAWEDVRN